MYIEAAVTDRMCQKWFAKFHTEDFSMDDDPWLGRQVEVDSDQIKTLTDNQALKISTSLVMLITLMFEFHIS